MVVDGYDRLAYASLGFGSLRDVKDPPAKMTAPDGLSLGDWWNYMRNVMKLAPVEKMGEIPEGVLQLGGTLVYQGDELVYQWKDAVPGDHPDLDEVAKILQNPKQ